MLHTLHIIGSKSLGGAERWFLRFTETLAEIGSTTSVIVRRDSALAALDWGLREMTPLPLRTVWDPMSKREVASEVARIRPDLVQTYMGRATRLTRLQAPNRPIHVARLGGYYKLSGYRHADAWVGNTLGICDYLLAHGFPKERVFHIYNFVEPPRLRASNAVAALRRAMGIPGDAWVVMTPGRFVEFKGHSVLLSALARLRQPISERPVWLVLLGDGPLGGQLYAQARQLGIDDRVVWTGWIQEPGPYYQFADLVVVPSLEREPFGNVVIEAWSYQKPLVTTAFRGALEFTADGEDVLRVPCGDDQALARGIRQVLEDRDFAQSLANAGLARASRDFSINSVMTRYLELYKTLLEHGRA